MKKWIYRILVALTVIFLGAVIWVELNKEKIAASAVEQINQQINGTLTYEVADVSLLRTFPYLGLKFSGIELRDHSNMNDPALIDKAEILLQLNLWQAITNPENITVHRFRLSNGQIFVKNYKDGSSNYALFDTNTSTKEPTTNSSSIRLEAFIFENVQITYIDEVSKLVVFSKELNIKGTIDVKANKTLVNSYISTSTILKYGAMIPDYELNMAGTLTLEASDNNRQFALSIPDLIVNTLPINLVAQIVEENNGYRYDVDLTTEKASITHLISLIPGSFKGAINGLKAQGSLALKAKLEGHTNDNYPRYMLEVVAQGQNIQYPDFPKRLDKLNFELFAENTSSTSAYNHIRVKNLELLIDKSFVRGDVAAQKSGARDNYIADIAMNFDLADWSSSVPAYNNQQILGTINGFVKANLQANQQNQMSLVGENPFTMELSMNDIILKEESKTKLNIGAINATSDQKRLTLDLKQMNYLNAIDIESVHGSINDIIGIITKENHPIKGQFNIHASLLNIDALPVSEQTTLYTVPNVELESRFSANEIMQNGYHLQGVNVSGILSNQDASVEFSVEDLMGNTFSGEGMFNNLLGFGLNSDTLVGSIAIKSQQFSLDPFLQSSDTSATEEALIPGNIILGVEYSAEQLKFKNFDFSRAIGEVLIQDQMISLKNEAKLFGGSISMAMSFDASQSDKYDIDLNLNLADLGFSETAKNTQIFKQLIPIASFIQGKYNSTFKWKSSLNKNFIPDLNTLTAYGDILTKGASISNIAPVQEFLQRFTNETDKGAIALKDINRYFAVQDGKVTLDKIDFTKEGIDFVLSGSHSFAQQIDYTVLMDIPTSKLNVDKLLNEVKGTLNINKEWLSIAPDSKVQLEIKMDGNLKKPAFKVVDVRFKTGNVVKSAATEVERRVNEEKDKIEQKIRDTLNTTIGKIEDIVTNARDSLTRLADSTINVIKAKADSTRTHVEEQINIEKEILKEDAAALIDSIKAGNLNIDTLTNKIQDKFGKIKNIFSKPTKKNDD